MRDIGGEYYAAHHTAALDMYTVIYQLMPSQAYIPLKHFRTFMTPEFTDVIEKILSELSLGQNILKYVVK
jgi:hypothetical protein